MKVILHYIKPFIPRMSVGISIKFIGALMELLLPWILSYLIDDIVPLRDIGLILLWGGAMVLAALLVFWDYWRRSRKYFGGLSGDLAGWFLQRVELWMLAAVWIVEWGAHLL